jgi:hypothetical protein
LPAKHGNCTPNPLLSPYRSSQPDSDLIVRLHRKARTLRLAFTFPRILLLYSVGLIVLVSRHPLRLLTQIHNHHLCYSSSSTPRTPLSSPHITTCCSRVESRCPSSSYSLPTLGGHHHALPYSHRYRGYHRHPNEKNTDNATCVHVLSVDAAATILETQTTSSSAITPISSPSPSPPLSARHRARAGTSTVTIARRTAALPSQGACIPPSTTMTAMTVRTFPTRRVVAPPPLPLPPPPFHFLHSSSDHSHCSGSGLWTRG